MRLFTKPSLVFAFLCLLALGACRSSPPVLPPELHPSAALPQGMDAYFYAEMTANRELLAGFAEETGMKSTGSAYFLEHTDFMYGAVRQAAGPEGAFFLAAAGDYSAGLVEFGIRWSDGWEEKPLALPAGEIRYYRHSETGMEIAVPSSNLILMASGGIEARLAALFGVPASPLAADVLAALENHSAGVYLPGGENLSLFPLFPPGLSLPLRDALFFTDPLGQDYTASGLLAFQNDRDALAASVMLRLIFSAVMTSQGMNLADIRTGLKVELNGEKLGFAGLRFPRSIARQFLFLMTPAARQGTPPEAGK
jgi:hypothetical protein